MLVICGITLGLMQPKRAWMLWLAYGVAVPVMVALPGQYVPHYYQLWMPVLCIGGGWTIAEFMRHAGGHSDYRLRTWGGSMVGMLALLTLTTLQIPSLVLGPSDASFRKFGPIFIYTEELARDIDALLKPGERFYQMDWETGLYFHTHRRPASGVFFSAGLLGGPLQARLSQQVIADFTRDPPPLVVFPFANLDQGHPVTNWLKTRYVPHPDNAQRPVQYAKLMQWAQFNIRRDPPAHVLDPIVPPLYFFIYRDSDLARRLGLSHDSG